MGDNGNNRAVHIVKELSNSNLNQDVQEELIGKMFKDGEEKDEDAILDKLFGKRNPQMYVTLIMSLMLIVVILILTLAFKENLDFVKFIWNIAIPAITLLWGYAFGKSQTK
ncbi:hypothetical protein [Enterocloster lavalensis]|uniref:hypothetical protein n=1 Tax=Enterocloster lavalensis TaxID=460384 RepID=UPI002665A115|nr:hypothetical protein [Enterocloster lavalensis]